MDPLSVLRDFTIRNELDKIVRVNDSYRFGTSYTFPCSIETAYRSKQGPRYTLETLVFFINNHHLKHTEYLPAARSHSIPAVTLPDRKNLLEYLTGVVPTSDSIEFLTPANPNNNLHPELYRPEDSFNSFSNAFDQSSLKDRNVNDNGNDNNDANVDYMNLIRSVERPLKDRESLLECKNRDFYNVLVHATRREEEQEKGISKIDKVVSVSGKGGNVQNMAFEEFGFESKKPKMHMKGGAKIGEGVPIILVPSAFQTLITIYNVKEFLEDGVFVSTDVKAKQMKGPKPDCITVQKKFSRDRVVTAYEVRDKPSALKADDWDRVVAVFVLGKEWQFKDWPFKDHVEIFNKILGFFMRFEDDSVESAKTVKQWNVKIITISKNKRHQDRAAALEVWDRLEEFVRARSHA